MPVAVIEHLNSVARPEVRTDGGWEQLQHTDCDYFLIRDKCSRGVPYVGALRLKALRHKADRLLRRGVPGVRVRAVSSGRAAE